MRDKMNKSKFNVDKKSVTEGDIVVATWECDLPDNVILTIDNGFNTSRLQLPDSGTRSLAVQKSKNGKTTLRLTTSKGGKIEHNEIVIRVKNIKPIKAKVHRPHSAGTKGRFSPKEWFSRVAYRLRSVGQQIAYGWRMLPERKRRTYKIIIAVLIALWIGTLSQNAGYRAGYERGRQDAISASNTHHS